MKKVAMIIKLNEKQLRSLVREAYEFTDEGLTEDQIINEKHLVKIAKEEITDSEIIALIEALYDAGEDVSQLSEMEPDDEFVFNETNFFRSEIDDLVYADVSNIIGSDDAAFCWYVYKDGIWQNALGRSNV